MQSFKEYITETKLFRYRRPSLSKMLGLTGIKKEFRQDTGLNTLARWKPSRIKQRLKQAIGLYSKPVRTIRQLSKGKIPSPFKLFPKIRD